MSGHRHTNDPGLTQNQGNVLGDRPCVRQSRLYREQCGGNAMKELLGQNDLKWNTTQTEGCYGGGSVYDHNTEDNRAVRRDSQPTEQQHAQRVNMSPEQDQVYQQQTHSSSGQQAGQPDRSQVTSASTGRGLRPGAGYANRQTYNIFSGK